MQGDQTLPTRAAAVRDHIQPAPRQQSTLHRLLPGQAFEMVGSYQQLGRITVVACMPVACVCFHRAYPKCVMEWKCQPQHAGRHLHDATLASRQGLLLVLLGKLASGQACLAGASPLLQLAALLQLLPAGPPQQLSTQSGCPCSAVTAFDASA